MASKINAKTTGTGGIEYTADASGEIELQSDGVTKAKVTANGLQDANGNSLRGGSFRNLIINGDMRIAQRGTSATGKSTSDYYICDRMYNNISSAGTWTVTQDTDVPTGQGFTNSVKYQCTTADASLIGLVQLYQKIEGQNVQHLKYGTSSAETTSFSFWVKSNKTGTYIYEIYQADASRSISKSFTIDSANTWEKKTITVVGDTSGVINNDNGEGYRVTIWLAASSTYTSGTLQTSWGALNTPDRAVGQVNLADSTSNYINITGLQLEVGSGASDFEFLPYDVQLARCQRYYQHISLTGTAVNTGEMGVVGPFRTEMRTSPGLSIYSTSGVTLQSEYTTHTLTRIGVGQVTVGNLTSGFLSRRGLYNIYCTGLVSGGVYVGSTYVSAEL